MAIRCRLASSVMLIVALAAASEPAAGQAQAPRPPRKTEHFDRDPDWDAHNNRISARVEPQTVRQDFGFSATSSAGGRKGEIGGWITPAAEPAYYALVIPLRTLRQPLSASGRLLVPRGGGNTLIGFFNRDTLNEWRTPNSLALRINARGEQGFHLHVEYCTAKWRAGGDFIGDVDPATQKKQQRLLSCDTVHRWSLRYDPEAEDGRGVIRVTLDDEELVMKLDPGHKLDGAAFDRFGILNVLKSFDGGGSIWLDDLEVNGADQPFDQDPQWEGRGNRRTYATRNIRPAFDFGFSPTGHAGGQAVGEIGGLLFRGDQRYPQRMACYGDRLGRLSLSDPLFASGKVVMRRGVTDSTVLIGFFHAEGSMRSGDAQRSQIPENLIGVAIEGPSREGFLFYPVYGVDREGESGSGVGGKDVPHIYPDGKTHDWTLRYQPDAAGGPLITVTLDGKPASLTLSDAHRSIGASFNRFGFVTTHIDGNGQEVFLDDLTYTAPPPGQ